MRHGAIFKPTFSTLIFIFLLLGCILPHAVHAQTPEPGNRVAIVLFWGDGCPHCAKAKPYLESLVEKYPGVELFEYEVYYNDVNRVYFHEMVKKYGIDTLAVPTIFIGSYSRVGYIEELQPEIEAAVLVCLSDGCADAREGVIPLGTGELMLFTPLAATPTMPAPTQFIASSPTPAPTLTGTVAPLVTPSPTTGGDSQLTVPLLGVVDLTLQPLALSTALIAFVDGFNPCSLWVLSMLMALTIHTGSRKKVVFIGLIFLTVTALIYALFIAGLFSIFKIISFLGWIRVVIAAVAIFFAIVNIKDYFWYQVGLSFTIGDENKTGIARRIHTLMDASQSFWTLAGGTVILAAGVSLVEFSCTAGFPVLWTNLLSSQNVGVAAFIFLLILYMLIYQLDEMVLFFSAAYSLKASRIEEKHGRILKLAGGMLMLTLGVVMLIDPALMNDLASSLLIFGGALVATLLVLFVHRIVLPRLGITFGSDVKKNRRKEHGHDKTGKR